MRSRIANKARGVHLLPGFSGPKLLIRCLMLVVCLLWSPSALAQPADKPPPQTAPKKKSKPPPVEIRDIQLGWGQVIPGDRWCPAFVWVTSEQNAFSGVLVVEYQQDATQTTRLLTPFTTTPGATFSTGVRF